MPDPKDLSNEELEEAIATPNPEEPVEEPEAGVTPEPEKSEVPEEVEEEEELEEEPKPPSRREQLRIQQVLEKLKQQPQVQAPKATGLNYGELDAEPELIKQLEADRQAAVNAAFEQNQEMMQTYRWETMVNLDSPQVDTQYPELDKNSPEFHKPLYDSIVAMYFQLSGVKMDPDGRTFTVTNPGIRYKDFVDNFYEIADEAANVKAATTTKNVAKQAAQAGLRPDGSKAKRMNLNQAPEKMTEEELKAVIAQAGM